MGDSQSRDPKARAAWEGTGIHFSQDGGRRRTRDGVDEGPRQSGVVLVERRWVHKQFVGFLCSWFDGERTKGRSKVG